MPSNPERLRFLFQHYLHDTGTPEEIQEFWELLSATEVNDPIRQDLWLLWRAVDEDSPVEKNDWEDVLRRIHEQAKAWEQQGIRDERRKIVVWRAVAAAAIILLLGSGFYFLGFHSQTKRLAGRMSPMTHEDISPGGNKAILTLANGASIILDSLHNGQLAKQGNTRIVKMDSGLLAYRLQSPSRHAPVKPSYNILRTPRGGQYQLILSDGTRVWLNAGSSIRFPTFFSGDERRVEITGEAYFEVAKNAAMPFIVTKGTVEIQVLGTHFNVNAYEDESAIKVTLLEGSVKVSELNTRRSRLIGPGEQAQVGSHGGIKLVKDVDLDEVVGWKNDLFWFEDDDIQTVMRQVSRWYNAEVVIKGNIPQHFTGSIPRDIMVSGVFEVLRRTGSIHFKVVDRKIIVSP